MEEELVMQQKNIMIWDKFGKTLVYTTDDLLFYHLMSFFNILGQSFAGAAVTGQKHKNLKVDKGWVKGKGVR